MNKVILMGRLTADPVVRYSQSAEPVAVARYTLAVNRRFKREGEADCDFIKCVSFGKAGEFVEKYFKKGQMVAIVGRLQITSYETDTGEKRWSAEVVTEELDFAESKSVASKNTSTPAVPANANANSSESFFPVDGSIDDEDMPF